MPMLAKGTLPVQKGKRETKLKSGSKTYINEIVPAFPRAACQKLILVQREVIHET